MITGAHFMIYSTNPETDRIFFRDILKLPNVDTGDGWLIFGLPSAEIAVHPDDLGDKQELYFMCDDIDDFVQQMSRQMIKFSPIQSQSWGELIYITLPGGGHLGIYEPRHEHPQSTK